MYEGLILDTAEARFAQVGVESCQVKEVASSAGISLATLYKYFPGKEALLRGVHVRRLDVLMERIADAVRESTGPLDEMLRGNEAYLAFHMKHPNYLGMHLREGNAWFETGRLRCPEQVEALERGLAGAEGTFRAGIDAGLFVDDPPRLQALAAIAANQVHLSHWVEGGGKDSGEVVVARAHGHFIRGFCLPERVAALLAEYGL